MPKCGTEISPRNLKGWNKLKFIIVAWIAEAEKDRETTVGILRSKSPSQWFDFDRKNFVGLNYEEAMLYIEKYMAAHGFDERQLEQDDD